MRVIVTQPSRRNLVDASDIANVGRLLRRLNIEIRASDLVLLPELVGGEADAEAYQAHASDMGVWVAGGSLPPIVTYFGVSDRPEAVVIKSPWADPPCLPGTSRTKPYA